MDNFNLTTAQRRVLQLLGRSGQMNETDLTKHYPLWRAPMRVLERKQLVSSHLPTVGETCAKLGPTNSWKPGFIWYLTKKCTQSGIMPDIMG